MRNANGTGTVYKMSGNRRRPWCAKKVSGWKFNGQPIYTYVGYYATKREAMDALALFNANPYDKRTTFGEAYESWLTENAPNLSQNTLHSYTQTYGKHFGAISKMKLGDMKMSDMQQLLNGVSHAVGRVCKHLFSNVFTYAVRHEIVTADRADLIRYLKPSPENTYKIERTVFTNEEIDAVTNPHVMILLYTGLRVGELLDLRPEDVHLEERWLQVRKAKTRAGVRVVPIAEKIVPFMSSIPVRIKYAHFNERMHAETGHYPHDTRHTFISRMADLGIDERITKAIVGHAGSGITETVYTHMDLKPLLEAVNKL